MANKAQRWPTNVSGEFYVDRTCIDCDQCREIASATFGDGDGHARVVRQPEAADTVHRALMAVVTCPVGAIGTELRRPLGDAVASFPERIEDNVYFCGFASGDSFGASSYLIVRPDGNVLVDSPRFASRLVKQIEQLGGVALDVPLARGRRPPTTPSSAAISDATASSINARCAHHSETLSARLTATGRSQLPRNSSPSPLPATRAATPSCSTATAFSLPVIISRGRPYAAASPPPSSTAGIPGPCKPNPWNDFWRMTSSGCCPDTGGAIAQPSQKCAIRSPVASPGCARPHERRSRARSRFPVPGPLFRPPADPCFACLSCSIAVK